MNLTPHFTLEELTRSQTAVRRGLNNTPNSTHVFNLERLAYQLEVIRTIVGKPIQITSGYRSYDVNAAVGGSKTSDHMEGCAADFVVAGMTPSEVIEKVKDFIPHKQLIEEFGRWVHFSIPENYGGEILLATKNEGKVTYERV
jgi:hypothetical protein